MAKKKNDLRGRKTFIHSELSATRRWAFLEDSQLPDLRLKRKKINPNDDLPMTDSGEWIIRKDIKRSSWQDYGIYQDREIVIQPPQGWLTPWTSHRGEASVIFGNYPCWSQAISFLEIHDLLQKLKDAGLSGWVPSDKRKEHLEAARAAIA